MPAKSVAQRRFMGMVRATQKGEMDNPSPELKRAAGDMSAKAVNKFAKTKEKNLPDKVEEETINERGDFWHPDPDKDRKLGGPGANQRAREDRGSSAKKSSGSNDKKLRPGESYYQYAKRMRTRKEDFIPEEAPTMSAGNGGFSGSADANGPTAGYDPMMGVSKLTGKKPKCKKRKFGFKCEETEMEEGYVKDGKYFPFYVEIADTNFIFHGRSEADVKLKLRKIYRPEQMKNLSITRYQPAQVLSYYWNKRKESM